MGLFYENSIQFPIDIKFKYYEDKFNEIPTEVLDKTLPHLKQVISSYESDLRQAINRDGLIAWAIPYHNFWGMGIRNSLRNIGLTDDLLPDNNWDDYYIQCIECALNFRERKEE